MAQNAHVCQGHSLRSSVKITEKSICTAYILVISMLKKIDVDVIARFCSTDAQIQRRMIGLHVHNCLKNNIDLDWI